MNKKQDIYLNEVILWEMVCRLKKEHPNDFDFGEKVRELVNLYG